MRKLNSRRCLRLKQMTFSRATIREIKMIAAFISKTILVKDDFVYPKTAIEFWRAPFDGVVHLLRFCLRVKMVLLCFLVYLLFSIRVPTYWINDVFVSNG